MREWDWGVVFAGTKLARENGNLKEEPFMRHPFRMAASLVALLCHSAVAFAVRDTGIGIPEDKQTAIFEPFVQADNSFSRRYGGAGLGLSIAKRLVKLMGGSLSIESKLGAGSLFQFNLWADVAADKNIDSGDLLTSSSL